MFSSDLLFSWRGLQFFPFYCFPLFLSFFFMFLIASLFRCLFKIGCPKWFSVYGINKIKSMQTPSLPLWWVSFLWASFQPLVSWSLWPFFPLKASSTSHHQQLSLFPTAGFLPGTPFSCDFTSSAAAALSIRILWLLACPRMVFRCMVFAYGLSFNMILRFSNGIFL